MARAFGVVQLVLAAFAALASVGAANGHSDSGRARSAYHALNRTYLDARSGDYRQTPRGRVGSHAWPFSQALAATIGIARLEGPSSRAGRVVPKRLRKLDARFRKGGVYHAAPGASVYYDDNEWIAEDLLDWDAMRNSPSARRKAAEIFQAVTGAWDGDSRKPCAGGVQWTNRPGNDDRNTVSTANGAVLGLRLYLLDRSPADLSWARRMVGWVERCLREPDGLYGDHIAGDGTVDHTEWSYNEGSMIEAYRLLYLATGDEADLAQAETIADTTLTAFRGRWSREPTAFAAIFFRRLLALAAADHRSAYVAAAQRYADRLWTKPRPQLFAQAGVVQVYAALAAPG